MTPRFVDRPSPRAAVITGAVFVAFLLWLFLPRVVDGTLRASDLWLVPVFGLVTLPFLAVTLGKRRYGSITLTDDELTVGRARLPVRGLRVHPGQAPRGTPLLGGAYGAPMGWSTVVLEGADGRYWRVATRRPEEFTRALSAVTAGGPEPR